MRRSAGELFLEIKESDEQILEIAEKLISECSFERPALRMIVTGGSNPSLKEPTFVIIPEELPTYPDWMYKDGIRISTVEFQRELPHIKSLNYMNAIRLEHHRKEEGVDDLLYYSSDGITELPRNNFYAFVGDSLMTAEENVLHGVTRKVVLGLAENEFSAERRKIAFEEIPSFVEAFTTSTTKGIMPITEIDGKPVGNGNVGDKTKRLMSAFGEYVDVYCEQ